MNKCVFCCYEDTFNAVWFAAGDCFSRDGDYADGRLFLAGTTVSKTGLYLSDDDADGVAA